MDVSRSAFYDWLGRPPSQHQQDDKRLTQKIRTSHENSRGHYGSRRVKDDLHSNKEQVSRARISRLMAQEGLQSTHGKKYKVTTDSRHKLPISPNFLNRDFDPQRPNQAYVSDITYV